MGIEWARSWLVAVALLSLLSGCSRSEPSSSSEQAPDGGTSTAPSESVETETDAQADGAGGVVSNVEVIGSIEVGESPWTGVVVDDLVWVPFVSGAVALDAGLEEVDRLEIVGHPETPLVFDGRLWFANIAEPILTVVDPTDPTEVIQLDVGRQGFTPVAAGGSVWVPNRADGTVSRVDPTTLQVVETLEGLDGVGALRVVADEVYASIGETVWQLSAEGGPVEVERMPAEPVEAFGATWTADGTSVAVEGGPVQRIPIGSPVSAVLATDESLFVAAASGLLRVDPATGAITGGIDAQVSLPLASAGGVWFLDGAAGDPSTIAFVDAADLSSHTVTVPGVPDNFALLGDTLIVSIKSGTQVVAVGPVLR